MLRALLLLCVLAAGFGLFVGLRWQGMDETAVISAVVEKYQQDTGGPASDCVAVPGAGAIWLQVACGQITYDVDWRGRIVRITGVDA